MLCFKKCQKSFPALIRRNLKGRYELTVPGILFIKEGKVTATTRDKTRGEEVAIKDWMLSIFGNLIVAQGYTWKKPVITVCTTRLRYGWNYRKAIDCQGKKKRRELTGGKIKKLKKDCGSH